MNSHPADGCDNVRDQFQAFCLENKIKLDPKKWQISNRQVRVRNPQNRNVTITTQALWIDCTSDMARYIRHAVHLLRPSHPSDSSYPLLYNLYFVPAQPFREFGHQEQFECAKMQKKIVDGRFTYKVGNWSPSLNLYMDAPWKETSRGELLADQSIASLILSEARGRHHNGKSFQLFSKIQSSERNQCVWHFQCRKEDSGLARHWLDSRLIPFLSNQFSHERNKEDGNLSFKMLGTPTRITTDGSGTGSVHAYNGSTEAYLDMCKSIISKKRWTNLRG